MKGVSLLFPVFLDIKGRSCVVIGGGKVAERRVKKLLRCNASVKVISPHLSPGLSQLASKGGIQVVNRRYKRGDLGHAFMVIVASDDLKINEEVTCEAKSKNILINVANNVELSHFTVPAVVRRGELAVAISTAGKSPALAKKIRSQLEQYFTREYADLLSLLSEVREQMKREGRQVNNRVWQECLDLQQLLEMLGEGKADEVKQALLSKLKGNDGSALLKKLR